MTTSVMRKHLIAYLSEADDKKIKGLYSLLEDNITDQSQTALTLEQLDFLNNERQLHLSGKSNSYTWEETKEFIRSNKKAS
jgi:hypothetical protein